MSLRLWPGPAPRDLRFGKFCTSLILPWHKVCSWVLAPNNHISSGNLPAPFLNDRGPGVVGWVCKGNCPPGGLASLLCTEFLFCPSPTPPLHSSPFMHLIPCAPTPAPSDLLLDKAAERFILVKEVVYVLNQLHFRVNKLSLELESCHWILLYCRRKGFVSLFSSLLLFFFLSLFLLSSLSFLLLNLLRNFNP